LAEAPVFDIDLAGAALSPPNRLLGSCAPTGIARQKQAATPTKYSEPFSVSAFLMTDTPAWGSFLAYITVNPLNIPLIVCIPKIILPIKQRISIDLDDDGRNVHP
jgi:hypothetical protein